MIRTPATRNVAQTLRANVRDTTHLRHSLRGLSVTSSRTAIPIPITAVGPPPAPPQPTASGYGDRVDKRRKQQEMLQRAKELRASHDPNPKKSSGPLKRRFWKEVHVSETPEGYRVSLDERPVRTPSKQIITIPLTKPHLAHAMAIEWDLLESAQQALKGYRIPITSLVSRAHDIQEEDAEGKTKIRGDIIDTTMQYLDTDTLLCWADEKPADVGVFDDEAAEKTESLRSTQMRTARPIIAYLTATVWPGVDIRPVLSEGTIMPVKQSDFTRSVISGWISGLPAFELAGLERAVIATKSLLLGTRLVVEWSEEFRDLQRDLQAPRFGAEQAAEAASLEVKWQTDMWGEVEDTHDVEKEDIRRQLGSAILMVSGIR